MKKVILLLIISLFLISNCEYFSIMSKKDWEEKADKEDDVVIYASGAYDDGGASYPCYWKITKDDHERIKLDSVGNMCASYSIKIIGNNVYNCGIVSPSTINACYWINKKRYDLEVNGPTFPSVAYNLIVNSGIVFSVGIDNAEACFWFNQKKSSLNINTPYCIFIDQISTSKHITYIGGINLLGFACYWKDGEIIDLDNNGAASSEVKSIYVIGNIVYSVGTLDGTQACLWKNKELTILPDGFLARSVFVSNEDIYISGDYWDGPDIRACYWKNTKKISLPPSNLASPYESNGNSIFIYNDNVYIAGTDQNGGTQLGWYCINGKKNIIENSLGATSIFITSDNKY